MTSQSLTVLVLSTDDSVRRRLERPLPAFQFLLVESEYEALELLRTRAIHALVLDVDCADGEALARCRRLRDYFAVPTLALVEAQAEAAMAEAVANEVVDDYLRKPIDVHELPVRIRARLGRHALPAGTTPDVVCFGNVEIHLKAKRVVRNGKVVSLPAKTYAVLAELVQHPRQALTLQTILRRIWGDPFIDEVAYVRVRMHELREKLEDDPSTPRYLQTAYEGYCFVPDEPSETSSVTIDTLLADLARLPKTLPTPGTPLIGRQGLLGQVVALLRQDRVRMVTLTGIGGMGKTRLALEVATRLVEDYADGVCFVALAAVPTPEGVLPAIARALGLRITDETQLFEAIVHVLRSRRLLMVLDNVEHLLSIGPTLSELLTAVPDVQMLVTSTTPLHLCIERVLAVGPMMLPPLGPLPSLITHHDYEAVALFCDRAQALVPSFALTPPTAPAVVAICHRLDGHPLALLLAAVQMRRYTPQELLLQLDDRLSLLVGGPADLPHRHQALLATIAWSYELLEEDEQQLFAQLAVFVGGWTSEAAETVCRLPDTASFTVEHGLDVLVEKSLLLRDIVADGTPRFAMLDTLRDFALQRLAEQRDSAPLRQRHAAYALALAEAAEVALSGAEQGRWLARLDHEHDNLRAALQWLFAHQGELALRLAAALRPFWSRRGYSGEGQRWLAQALTQRTRASIPTRAKVLNAVGVIAWEQGHYKVAQQYLEESLLLRRAIGNPAALVDTLCNLAIVLQDQDQYDSAYTLYSESLALIRQAQLEGVLVYVLNDLGALEYNRGNYDAAQQHSAEALVLATQHEDTEGIAIALDNLGMVVRAHHDYREAEQLFHRALVMQRELRSPHGVAHTLTNLGVIGILRNDYLPAGAHLHEALRLYAALDSQQGMIECLEALANVAAKTGDDLRAVRLWSTTSTLRTQLGMGHTVADAQRYGAMLNELHQRLDGAQFARAFGEGGATSIKDAVDALLAQDDVAGEA